VVLKLLSSKTIDIFFTPVIAPILAERREGIAVAILGLAHIVMVAMGFRGWVCPIEAATGIPCPGCYLGGAIEALLHGKWAEALHRHIFAPFFLFGVIIITLACLLPTHLRLAFSKKIAYVERKTGFMAIFLAALLIYWVLRLFWLGFD